MAEGGKANVNLDRQNTEDSADLPLKIPDVVSRREEKSRARIQSQLVDAERLSQLVEIEHEGRGEEGDVAKELEKTDNCSPPPYDRQGIMQYITVSLSVPERQFLAPEVILRPEDSMAAVLKKLRSAMEESGMAIAEFPPCEEFTVSIINPFARTNEGVWPTSPRWVELTVVTMTTREHRVGSKKPGTELRFKEPSFCGGQTARGIDYFTCRDCGFNWVCQPCAEICHKGHSLVSYLRNHKPTWACCYCPKKKKCSIQDKPS
ncbi:hypothetical protein GBAR_LOCUS19748 [Geodia barretti]|uniref:Zinc finger protein n=1 Tax=Geodia barretti TaxID=519541 RepID=A0AA35WW96_GEOBA|nr:hypothetical protein GBAR_LOCUS19748 [Geodia barretti]